VIIGSESERRRISGGMGELPSLLAIADTVRDSQSPAARTQRQLPDFNALLAISACTGDEDIYKTNVLKNKHHLPTTTLNISD
jgi:hypothetical protein